MKETDGNEHKAKGKRLLLVGPTIGSVHVRNFFFLIKDYFEDVLIVGNAEVDFCKSVKANFSIKNPLKIRSSIRHLSKIIHDFKPDIIHAHQANSLAYMVVRANKNNIPLVLTCWGSDVLLLPERNFLMKTMVKLALKRSSVITVDASYMKSAVERLIGNKKVVLVNFGIEISDGPEPKKEKLVYSNRLHKSLYRIDHIIKAFALFYKNHPDWKLVVGATGELTPDLQKLASEILPTGSFEFVGFLDADANRQFYQRSQIWVSYPLSDGTSISLLEAMAYGCVPVVSDLPANREWINNNQNGCVAEENNLSDSFERVLNLPFTQVAAINRTIVLQKATKSANRKIFYNLYDELFAVK